MTEVILIATELAGFTHPGGDVPPHRLHRSTIPFPMPLCKPNAEMGQCLNEYWFLSQHTPCKEGTFPEDPILKKTISINYIELDFFSMVEACFFNIGDIGDGSFFNIRSISGSISGSISDQYQDQYWIAIICVISWLLKTIDCIINIARWLYHTCKGFICCLLF